MADGKWISDLTTATPLEDAARRVLKVRFSVVREFLPLALHQAERDPEHVHQLRVGTRRARAALDIFVDCLPAKVHKSAKKHLRKIRRAAGDARDWDVFLAQLAGASKPGPRHRAGRDLLAGYGLAQRRIAQAQLEALGADYPDEFERVLADTTAAVRAPDDSSQAVLIDLAQPLLLGLVRELESAAAGDLDDYAHLHQVRIIGKRLRYAMEVFAACFADEFRDALYPAIEEMQEILGAANDSHVARGRLEDIERQLSRLPAADAKRLKTGIAALRKHHEQRLPQQVEQFRGWWERWQQGGGEAGFARLIKATGASVA
jgi:CHAD domain-containing protein